jgi:hypothetical protein
MNSKIGIQTNKAKLDVYCYKPWITSSISMCPWSASPGPYLCEAGLTATFPINRMPSQIMSMKSPCELLFGENKFPVVPKVFGCTCFVIDHRPSVSKLDPKAVKCFFIRDGNFTHGYGYPRVPYPHGQGMGIFLYSWVLPIPYPFSHG